METVGRIFAAVPLSPDARLALFDQLGNLDIPGKRVPPENWHITLRFLGTLEDVVYDRFLEALGSEELPARFAISFDGVGGFPNKRRAAVVWAGITKGREHLDRLNEIAEGAAQSAGLPAEERPYRPHVTLSRVRPPEKIGHLDETVIRVGYVADRVIVYRSRMGGGPTRYEPLEEFELSK